MSLLNSSSDFNNLSGPEELNEIDHNGQSVENSCTSNQDTGQSKKGIGKKEKVKRVRNEMNHKTKLRKFLRNTGQEYVTKAGKVIKAKAFEDKDCGCSKKCNSKIEPEDREKCFDKFWKLGNFSKQNTYLNGLVTREAVKQHRPRINVKNRGPKGVTYQYRVNIGRISKQVCKVYFLDTFVISNGRLARALRKEENERDPGEDLRGKKTPVNKTPPEKLDHIRGHINSFPRYDQNYNQNSKGRYLKSDLNVKRMYSLYTEDCQIRNILSVKENIYRRVFNTEFNLHFLSPRNDPCSVPKPPKPKSLNRPPRMKKREQEPDILMRGLDHSVPMRTSQGCNLQSQMFCTTDSRSQNSSTMSMPMLGHEKDLNKTTQGPIYNFSPATCQALLTGAGPPFYPQDQGHHPVFHNQAPNFYNM